MGKKKQKQLKCPVEELIQWEIDGPWYTYDGELATEKQVKEYFDFKKKLQEKIEKANNENQIEYQEYVKNHMADRFLPGIERAFAGHGGHIFEEYYLRYLFDEREKDFNLLQYFDNLKEDLQDDLNSELFDHYEEEKKEIEDFISQSVSNEAEAAGILVNYYANHREGYPEACGVIIGIMIRDGYKKEANNILKLNELDDFETLYWDT